jgi:hypothetical protein
MNQILAPADIAHYYSRLAKPSTLPAAHGRSSRAPARGIAPPRPLSMP